MGKGVPQGVTSLATSSLDRYFVTVGGCRQVHYRRGGAGPPLVLLHASPRSSAALVPLAEALATRFSVVALDTPGYGSSDPLPGIEQPEILDHAAATAEVLGALGIERCALYGTHTGASIALELASSRPDLVEAAVLDALPILTSYESASLLQNLPAYRPQPDGGHLTALWERVRAEHLYFPWFDQRPAARVDAPMPSAACLHQAAMDLLRAGEGYRAAYAATFRYSSQAALASLETPVAVIACENDPQAAWLERLPRLPECVETARLAGGRDELCSWIAGFAARHLSEASVPEPPSWSAIPDRMTRTYVKTSVGQLHVRGRPGEDERPLVVFHASPGSARMLHRHIIELMRSRPVLAIDTLGNGESDKPPGWEHPTSWEPTGPRLPRSQVDPEAPWITPGIADYAASVVELIDALGLEELDLYGSHTGGSIAIEVAVALGPDRARNVIVDGLAMFSEAERDDLLACYTPPLEPRWDGAHLPWAWAFLRAQTEFWPWYYQTREGIRWVEPIPAKALHTWVVELLKSGHTYPLAYNAAFAYRAAGRLPHLRSRTLIAATSDDMLAECSASGARLAPNAVARDLPPDPDQQCELLVRFLGGDDLG